MPSLSIGARVFLIIAGVLMGVSLAMIFGGFVNAARAHEAPSGWSYPAGCCSNRDCNRIPASRVSEGPEGYRVELFPGDHDMVPTGASYLIPYSLAKQSPDGEYHLCILPSGTMLCWFVPPKGM